MVLLRHNEYSSRRGRGSLLLALDTASSSTTIVYLEEQYVTEPTFPKCLLSKHMETDTHKEARQIRQLQPSYAPPGLLGTSEVFR